jgi:ribosomal protein L32
MGFLEFGLIAPVAEYVAQELWSSISKPASTPAPRLIATRLTQSRRRSVKGSEVPSVKAPKPESVCRGCGITTRRGTHCPRCGREVSREKLIELAKIGRVAALNPESRKKHSETQRRHEAAERAWRSSPQADWPDENTFVRQIQPRLTAVTISALASTLGVSVPYAAYIRALPHALPRGEFLRAGNPCR